MRNVKILSPPHFLFVIIAGPSLGILAQKFDFEKTLGVDAVNFLWIFLAATYFPLIFFIILRFYRMKKDKKKL